MNCKFNHLFIKKIQLNINITAASVLFRIHLSIMKKAEKITYISKNTNSNNDREKLTNSKLAAPGPTSVLLSVLEPGPPGKRRYPALSSADLPASGRAAGALGRAASGRGCLFRVEGTI